MENRPSPDRRPLKEGPRIRSIGFHIDDGEELALDNDASVTVADGAAARIVIRPKKGMNVKIHCGKNCDIRTLVIGLAPVEFSLESFVDAGSIIETDSFWGGGGAVSVITNLEGKGAKARERHLFVTKGGTELRLGTVLTHRAKETSGDILSRGVVKDRSRARLDGMIKVEKNGPKAESFLSEHVIVLDKGASASARPELEILNNDVASRHSASVSPIDERKVFYLMARGLCRDDARGLILGGFFASAIGRIGDEKARTDIEGLVRSSI